VAPVHGSSGFATGTTPIKPSVTSVAAQHFTGAAVAMNAPAVGVVVGVMGIFAAMF